MDDFTSLVYRNCRGKPIVDHLNTIILNPSAKKKLYKIIFSYVPQLKSAKIANPEPHTDNKHFSP